MGSKIKIPYVYGERAQLHKKKPVAGDIVIDLQCGDGKICAGKITDPRIESPYTKKSNKLETEYEVVRDDLKNSVDAHKFASRMKHEELEKSGRRANLFYRFTNGATDWELLI